MGYGQAAQKGEASGAGGFASVLGLCYTIKDTTTGEIVFPPKNQNLLDVEKSPALLSEIPQEKSVVCFYRTWGLWGAMVALRIFEGADKIARLPNASFSCLHASPGEHRYESRFPGSPVPAVNISAAPGSITYIRAFTGGEQLVAVPKEEAEKVLKSLEQAH